MRSDARFALNGVSFVKLRDVTLLDSWIEIAQWGKLMYSIA